MATSPTFVIVPGHWHTLVHAKPLVDALQKRSHRTRAVQLHTVGLKTGGPRPCFSDDVSVIYSAASQELLAGNDVCLVLHSYAGMPGAEAVNRLITDGALDEFKRCEQMEGVNKRGRLLRVVFIAAYIFPAGYVMDQKNFVGPDNPGFTIDENNFCHLSSPWHKFFNDLPLSAAKPFVDALGPVYYVGPATLTSENWRKANVFAILCKKDNAMPPERQETMWKGVESQWIDACHTCFVSRPEEVADTLVRLVEGGS